MAAARFGAEAQREEKKVGWAIATGRTRPKWPPPKNQSFAAGQALVSKFFCNLSSLWNVVDVASVAGRRPSSLEVTPPPNFKSVGLTPLMIVLLYAGSTLQQLPACLRIWVEHLLLLKLVLASLAKDSWRLKHGGVFNSFEVCIILFSSKRSNSWQSFL